MLSLQRRSVRSGLLAKQQFNQASQRIPQWHEATSLGTGRHRGLVIKTMASRVRRNIEELHLREPG